MEAPPAPEQATVGLALGSGGARGCAHIGVISVLDALQLPVYGVAGCSIGALIGALYALGRGPAELASLALGSRIGRAVRPRCSRASLLDPAPLIDLVHDLVGEATFRETRMPLAITALDLDANERFVLHEGSIAPAVIASMMVPVLLPPYPIGGRLLNDPGIFDSVPLDVTAWLGSDVVIGVSADLEAHGRWRHALHRPPVSRGVAGVARLLRTTHQGSRRTIVSDLAAVLRRSSQGPGRFPLPERVVWVRPDFRGMSSNAYAACNQATEQGAAAMRQVLPTLEAMLRSVGKE